MNDRFRSLTIAICTLLALPVLVLAGGPVGPHYHIHRETYAATSGGVGTSPSYTLQGTLGQISVSSSAVSGRSASGGIWRGASAANVLVLEKAYRDETPPTVEAGDEIIFVVAVTNNGYRAQENVVVTDTLPAGIVLTGTVESDTGVVRVDDDTITLEIAELSYDQIAILIYRVLVDAHAEGWTITNTATASSDLYGPIDASAAIHVREPSRIYLPLVTRTYPPLPAGPEVHTLQDAPNICPGHAVEIGDHLYRDDWDALNDNDWYSFQAVAGRTYVIQSSELEARADTIMTLFDSDCETELAHNDDIAWPDNVASRITWTAPSNGTYHVMVRSYDWQVFGNDTGYTFGAVIGGTEADMQSAPGAPIKPPPPPTPVSDSDSSSNRSPGHASMLPQKPPPPPTPQKPPPAPTPGPASPPPAPSGEGSQDPTPVVLLPETGSASKWPSLASWIVGLFLTVGIWMYRR
ncbi:MAG: DUF11 domain-containing protein [Chloroflexi bacterium]|nr:DUF11 domain-containing protein [Chloroflexota bacterium]